MLFEKKLCVNEIKIFFEKNNLYLHDKYNKQIFKTFNRKKFYIVNKITFQLNDYILIASRVTAGSGFGQKKMPDPTLRSDSYN